MVQESTCSFSVSLPEQLYMELDTEPENAPGYPNTNTASLSFSFSQQGEKKILINKSGNESFVLKINVGIYREDGTK